MWPSEPQTAVSGVEWQGLQPPCPLVLGSLILHGVRRRGQCWPHIFTSPNQRLSPGPAALLPVLQLLAADAHGTLVALCHAHLVPAALHLLAGVLGGVQGWGEQRGAGAGGDPSGEPISSGHQLAWHKVPFRLPLGSTPAPAAASQHAPAPVMLPAGREKPGGCRQKVFPQPWWLAPSPMCPIPNLSQLHPSGTFIARLVVLPALDVIILQRGQSLDKCRWRER